MPSKVGWSAFFSNMATDTDELLGKWKYSVWMLCLYLFLICSALGFIYVLLDTHPPPCLASTSATRLRVPAPRRPPKTADAVSRDGAGRVSQLPRPFVSPWAGMPLESSVGSRREALAARHGRACCADPSRRAKAHGPQRRQLPMVRRHSNHMSTLTLHSTCYRLSVSCKSRPYPLRVPDFGHVRTPI